MNSYRYKLFLRFCENISDESWYHHVFLENHVIVDAICIPFSLHPDPPNKLAVFVWLVVWLPFFYFPINIGFLIIPIDELIFFRGVSQPPTSCWLSSYCSIAAWQVDRGVGTLIGYRMGGQDKQDHPQAVLLRNAPQRLRYGSREWKDKRNERRRISTWRGYSLTIFVTYPPREVRKYKGSPQL